MTSIELWRLLIFMIFNTPALLGLEASDLLPLTANGRRRTDLPIFYKHAR